MRFTPRRTGPTTLPRLKRPVRHSAEADAVVDGLTTLSNTEDERAEDRAERRRDPEGTRYARLSAGGLSELSVRVCRAIGTARTT